MRLRSGLVVLALATSGFAQNAQQQQRRIAPLPPSTDQEFLTNKPANVPTSLGGEEYRIGRDDLIEVTMFESSDLGGTGRVSASGIVSLPLIGAIEAAGKTTQEVERAIEEAFKAKYVNDPHVTVFVREYASQPVSIVGAVKMPGIYQMKGQKFLLDMLATAQGIDQLTAGQSIQVIRRTAESADAAKTITVSAEDLFQNGKTELNIPIQPGDIINVLQAGSVFVVGEVVRPGEFPLRQGKSLTVVQAVALGSGFTREAKKAACKIIRIHGDGTKEEIPVNVGKIFDGSLTDVMLTPNDIFFVPSNKVKTGLMRTLDTTIAVVSGRLIYHF
jgi:polysaccharide export outer membrane protein